MNKSYSRKFKAPVVTIFPGECYISNTNEIISTVLGSCISVCLYDIKNNIGGMNHFMLPQGKPNSEKLFTADQYLNMDELSSKSMRFGITAMEVLLAMMVKKGAKRENLRAKIFGGGNVLSSMTTSPTVGEKNIIFVKSYLKTEQIRIENENISGNIGRKIFFLTGSKSIFVKQIPITRAIEEDEYYSKALEKKKVEADITIF